VWGVTIHQIEYIKVCKYLDVVLTWKQLEAGTPSNTSAEGEIKKGGFSPPFHQPLRVTIIRTLIMFVVSLQISIE